MNNNKLKIKEYFLLNPTARHRVRELERVLKLPLPSVVRYCKELKMENMLDIQKIGDVIFYCAHRSSQNYILAKKLFNLKKIYQSGFIDFLKKEMSNPTVVLFGSYLRGEDVESSDIDIFIQTKSKKVILVDKFEKYFQRELQLFIFSDINKITNKNLANNIMNGYVLNGFLEVY